MWHIWGKYYVDGNVNSKYPEVTLHNWDYGVWNQIDRNGNDGTYTATTQDTIRLREPMPFAPVTTHSAERAYELVLEKAGASLHRDQLDAIIVKDVREGHLHGRRLCPRHYQHAERRAYRHESLA